MDQDIQRLLIVSASQRKDSESFRYAIMIKEESRNFFDQVDICELYSYKLPFFDGGQKEEAEVLKKTFSQATAYVFVVPEWNGGCPPIFSNALLYLSSKDVGHKPVYMVSLSAGTGGAYPIVHMRSFLYKNNHFCYIPEHLIVRKCSTLFCQKKEKDFLDKEVYVRKRLLYGLRLLKIYDESLFQVRSSGVINIEDYPFGM